MRRANDAYYSPSWAVDMLLEHVKIKRGSRILEPCVGYGDIEIGLLRHGYEVLTNDIDRSLPANTYYDYLQQPFAADWIITNPPFSDAFRFLKKAMDETSDGVALLLRLSFLEPTFERGAWLEHNPPTALIVLPRFSFTGDGKTDSVTCAWMVWVHSMYPQIQYIAIKSKGER